MLNEFSLIFEGEAQTKFPPWTWTSSRENLEHFGTLIGTFFCWRWALELWALARRARNEQSLIPPMTSLRWLEARWTKNSFCRSRTLGDFIQVRCHSSTSAQWDLDGCHCNRSATFCSEKRVQGTILIRIHATKCPPKRNALLDCNKDHEETDAPMIFAPPQILKCIISSHFHLEMQFFLQTFRCAGLQDKHGLFVVKLETEHINYWTIFHCKNTTTPVSGKVKSVHIYLSVSLSMCAISIYVEHQLVYACLAFTKHHSAAQRAATVS